MNPFRERVVDWNMPASRFVWLLSLLNTVLYNGALYSFLNSRLDLFTISGLSIAASVVVVVFLLNLFFITALAVAVPFAVKPLFVLTASINSVALYFLVSYQVVLDRAMMGNVFNTRSSESLELLTPSLVIYFVVLAVIPGVIVSRIRLRPVNRLRSIANLVLAFAAAIAFLYLNSTSWLWIDRHASMLGGKILPWSYTINSVRYYSGVSRSTEGQIPLPDGEFDERGKVAVVLVIGETARAANFELYGYPRPTNPLLKAEELLVFDQTTSCTTYTTASVACMLSHDVDASGYEPLPSYLARLGADVGWRSNNWGEPPIEVTRYQKGSGELREACRGDGCRFDEVLLTGMAEEIRQSESQRVFIVLHTKGSHGPSYYARYPPEFERFTPVCRSEEISKCTQQELINAYDNTILYTDYFLREAIVKLEQLGDTPVMLIYASDHGESLGEQGLYLHGTPYLFAPDVQKEIPFMVWRSEAMIRLQGVRNEAVRTSGRFSHANVFHTVVGALGLRTPVYDRDLDLLSGSKSPQEAN